MSIDKDFAQAVGTILDTIIHPNGHESAIRITKDETNRTIDLHIQLHDARDLDTIIVALRKSAETILGEQ